MYHFVKSKYILLILSFAVFFYSCSEKKHDGEHDHHHQTETSGNAEVDSLKNQVMAVHDEVMPKMEEIMALELEAQQQIKQLDSLAKINPKQANATQKQQLDSLVVQLNKADDAMTHWMQEFDGQMKSKTDEEKITYLKSEKDKIDAVRDQMLGSINKGKELLKK